MRIPIPFLPTALSIRMERRTLTPRPFRFTLRRLLIAVALSALWLSMVAWSGRLRVRGSDYAREAGRVWEASQMRDQAGFDRLVDLSNQYHRAAELVEWPLIATLILAAGAGLAFGLSAALGPWVRRRSATEAIPPSP